MRKKITLTTKDSRDHLASRFSLFLEKCPGDVLNEGERRNSRKAL